MIIRGLLFLFLAAAVAPAAGESPFDRALSGAEASLQLKDFPQAQTWVRRALERDPKSPKAWAMRAKIAIAMQDTDEYIYSLHQQYRLLLAQKSAGPARDALFKQIESLDPLAPEFLKLRKAYIDKIAPIAQRYEKDGRPHSAIRAHQFILALDPERKESEDAIQRIAAAPDPSLAESAKPKDLLSNVSDEWIHEFDSQHDTWETRAKNDRDNYTTYTDAGYAVVIRAGEAMEQMNAFYRVFFHYGTPDDKKRVGKIEVHIFKNRDEYLKKGQGPPVEWSGGQFTGGAVETYVGNGGFEEMVTVLFHEAAHQFVSMSTSAAGWLNEGLASYFEGTRILANGTVIMNLPANHRLFPLADRMQKGWMASSKDGIDPKAASKEPETAPTFRIVLENEYAWGPPWYAPTWGVVYFLWNYQDPVDGRFVYRAAFQTFINSSGGRMGKGAIDNFEKVVLANPSPPTPKLDPKLWKQQLPLPKTVDELTEVWKTWMFELRDEQMGRLVRPKPWMQWAKYALQRGEIEIATEHFEKGILANPDDVDLLLEFGKHLVANLKNPDRASKLAMQALRFVESKNPPDAAAIKRCESYLIQWDGNYQTLEILQKSLAAAARSIARRYLDAELPMMSMDVSWHLASDTGLSSLYEDYEAALRKSGRSLALYKLAYNEKNLDGWSAGNNTAFQPKGEELFASFGAYSETNFDSNLMTVDTVTLGDFSIETELLAEPGAVNYAGIVFGRKTDSTYHGFIYFPPRSLGAATGRGYVDLTSFFGGGQSKVWRHNPVKAEARVDGTVAAVWHKMRVDVAGRLVDVYFDEELIVTNEFPTSDVLRGGFGIITGAGKSQFRNIRYLARPARDRAAQVERAMRLGARANGPQGEGGSWLGSESPFPSINFWETSPRNGWREKGPVPTLLVFWSIQQNEQIPINEWLADLYKRYEDTGLEIINIAMAVNSRELPDYLKKHPFPGSVGVDSTTHNQLGNTFSQWGIDKFGMPRVVLLDVDHKVKWEGDPGLKAGEPWKPGKETYLDAPLDELVSSRKLREVYKWHRDWTEKALPALRDGDFPAAVPFLRAARAYDGSADEYVLSAQSKLSVVEGALGTLDTLVPQLVEMHAEPVLATLVAWGKSIDKNVPPQFKQLVAPAIESQNVKSWNAFVEAVKSARGKLPPGKELDAVSKLAERFGDAPGVFIENYTRELRSAIGYDDLETVNKLLADVEKAPGRYLARSYFRW